ncbi:hypothetical protein B0J13DRAFT_591185 [Dactylonectria estremocensis]|uniref:Uncharacterized protein n=1 Tax=Dactylonectria estremocensis TaxID=1079267 RepID=A0A9P9CZW4_9HYPO|nr:hypothetical protein B0J13DRAFT_591185 [Dactylonectria estremocensis]
MEELEYLRKQLREEQRRREEAEGRVLEEQREAAEGRALEEQHQREEEQCRREEAEERASASQLLTLYQYLETCHSLSAAIEVVTDRSLTTQGATTNPTDRIYPRRIIPFWDQLSFNPSFCSQAAFPSRHQLEYVRSLLHPVNSELGLRNSLRDVVENAVQKLVDETHTNLGNADESLSESIEQMSIGTDGSGATTTQLPRPPNRATHRRKARGNGNRADQFFICHTSDDRNIPAVAIEYKPPHKLSRDEVVTGLVSEIEPDRDVIQRYLAEKGRIRQEKEEALLVVPSSSSS